MTHFFKKHRALTVILTITLLCFLFPTAGTAQMDLEAMRKRFSGRQASLDSMVETPKDRGMAFEAFTVQSSDEITISGWWIPQENAPATVLVVHGFSMNKSHMLSRAAALHALGLNVALIDLRARGESGGELTLPGPKSGSDVVAVADYLRKLSPAPLVLYGFSHGARAVIFASESTEAVALIAESPPYSLANSFKLNYKTDWAPPIPEGNLTETVSRWTGPVLLLGGATDPHLTAIEASQLIEASPNSDSRVRIFDGVGHGVLSDSTAEAYGREITSFLRTDENAK